MFEAAIQDGLRGFYFDPNIQAWRAVGNPLFDDSIFSLVDIPETGQAAFPQALLELLQTHEALADTILHGHGPSPSVVDGQFLRAVLENRNLRNLSLFRMVISDENWKAIQSINDLHILQLWEVALPTHVSLEASARTLEWSLLPRSLRYFSWKGIEHSLVLLLLEQVVTLPNLEGFCAQLRNEQEALACEKVLKCSAAIGMAITFWSTSFTAEIINPLLRGLHQTSVASVCFFGGCEWKCTASEQNQFFEELNNNLSIHKVDIRVDSVLARKEELRGWFQLRQQLLPLVRRRAEVRPAFWPHVLKKDVLEIGYGSDVVFLLLRWWPTLVPSSPSRKRARTNLSNY